MIRALFFALLLLVYAGNGFAEPMDTPERRLEAANHLFDFPAYRLVASRQINESIKFLPEAQYRRAMEGLSNPKVASALREVIVRSMAQTFSFGELEFLARFSAADEARSMVGKLGSFEVNMTRELLGASLTNPDLSGVLLGQ